MTEPLSQSAARFQEAIAGLGFSGRVVQLEATTRTARDAAQAIGCGVEQICKSLVLRGEHTGEPVLVIASGVNRVDEKLIGEIVAEPVGMAKADYVRERSGYAVGGVPPFGHPVRLRTIVDADLLQYPTVWAAAGHPRAVFELTPADLVRVSEGQVAPVCPPRET
jgi:prolyl-tRNA editing enzyme YbaK/EbsC (Cys-tRNA(Pro) deacylase)